jgi:hypothetical protein
VFSNGAGANEGRLDASVSDRFCGERSQECLSLVGGLAELLESLAVRNHTELGAGDSLVVDADWLSSERSSRCCLLTDNKTKRKRKETKKGKISITLRKTGRIIDPVRS